MQAAKAPRRRSPEQAAAPVPPTPAWASAWWIARPMSTEQEIRVSSWLAFAPSVIRGEPGSLRYFSFKGLCTDLRSKFILPGSLPFSGLL